MLPGPQDRVWILGRHITKQCLFSSPLFLSTDFGGNAAETSTRYELPSLFLRLLLCWPCGSVPGSLLFWPCVISVAHLCPRLNIYLDPDDPQIFVFSQTHPLSVGLVTGPVLLGVTKTSAPPRPHCQSQAQLPLQSAPAPGCRVSPPPSQNSQTIPPSPSISVPSPSTPPGARQRTNYQASPLPWTHQHSSLETDFRIY